MNKVKLRSLMFHAGFCNEDGGWDNRSLFEQENDNFQKFAELIVRECCQKLENDGMVEVAMEMKEYFGVKE